MMNLGVHVMLAAAATVGATLAPPARRLDESADTQWMLGSYSRVTVPLDDPNTPSTSKRMAWTPRISGDGNWATFYSDSNYGDLAAGTGDYRDYQIYAADLRTHPYSVHLVFAHATKDSKAPEMSYDGKRVVLVNDGELHLGTRADDGTYSTANLHERWAAENADADPLPEALTSTGGASITESGSKWTIVYSGAKSTGYNVYKLTESAQDKLVLSTVNTDTTTEERAGEPEISADASTVVFQSKFDDTRPDHREEIWVYHDDDSRHQVTAQGRDCNDDEDNAPNDLLTALQQYWGDAAEFNFTSGGAGGVPITGVASTSCSWAAAAGIQSGVKTIGARTPSVSGDGRFVTFTTNWDAATALGAHEDPQSPATTIVFLFDSLLGVTTRVGTPARSDVSGQHTCCPTASSATSIAKCDFDDRLMGKCCDQKPCRLSALNPTVSADGSVIVFVSDVDHEGSSDVHKGDLEVFLHHVHTRTTRRVTYTYNDKADETFPHISADGRAIVFSSTAHYGSATPVTNKDVFLTRLTFGCDDPMATNYHADADVAECCVFPDAAALDGTPIAFDFTLDVNLTAALGRVVGSTAEQSAAGWQEELADDLACALRIPSNQIDASVVSATDLLAATSPSDGHFAVRVHIDSAQLAPSRRRLDAVDTKPAETAEQITARLVAQLRDARSAIWKGVASRYIYSVTKSPAGTPATLYTRDLGAAEASFTRGTLMRLTSPTDEDGWTTAKRESARPALSGDGKYVVLQSDSNLDDGDDATTFGDNVYHIWRHEIATGKNVPLLPDMDTGDDAKYPAVSADGKVVCFYANLPDTDQPHFPDHVSAAGSSSIYHWWVAKANADNTAFEAPKMVSWTSDSGRKLMTSKCAVSADGSTVVFSSDSRMAGSDSPGSKDYQAWSVKVADLDSGNAAVTLISGGVDSPTNPLNITGGSDCFSDGAVSADGAFVALRCKGKEHPDGTVPVRKTTHDGTAQDQEDEGFLYDRANDKLTLFTDLGPANQCYDKTRITAMYRDYWGDERPGYNFTDAGISVMTTSSCAFAAAAGMQPGVGNTGVGNGGLSIDDAGRYVAYTADFQLATAFGTHDPRLPVSELNGFVYDRVLGITTRFTNPPSFDHVGAGACCKEGELAGCDFDDRLMGKCCDQKPCRKGAGQAKISGDGQKIVYYADVNYDGVVGQLPEGDLELFLYHAPTSTSHRLTYTYHASSDDLYPHISADGKAVVFQTKHNFAGETVGDEDANDRGAEEDVWLMQLTYGCDDPRATNYVAGADIPECCVYDAETAVAYMDGAPTEQIALTLAPIKLDGAPMSAAELMTGDNAAEKCDAWQDALVDDLVCALRVSPTRVQLSSDDGGCAADGDAPLKVTVDLVMTATAGAPTPQELTAKLLAQLRDPNSALWKGRVSKYLKKEEAIGLSSTTLEPPPSPPPPSASPSPPPSPKPSPPPPKPPPPPSPSPPPPPPPATEVVKTEFTAAGDVQDYDYRTVRTIKEVFAEEAGVNVEAVSVTVMPASVKIIVEIEVLNAAAATTVSTKLQTKLADAVTATAFLEDAKVTVEQIDSAPAAVAPPASRGDQSLEEADDDAVVLADGDVAGIVVAAAVGAMALFVCGVMIGLYMCKPAKPPAEYAKKTATELTHIKKSPFSSPRAADAEVKV